MHGALSQTRAGPCIQVEGFVLSPEGQIRAMTPLAIAGTGYGIIGILVIVLLVILIFYFLRRA